MVFTDMRFIFWGTADFARSLLQELLNLQFRPALIISSPPKPQGRKHLLTPSPVHSLANQVNIPVLTPTNLQEPSFLEKLRKVRAEFSLLTAYGQIIPLSLLHLFPKKFLNLHPSLLPRWRGATPIQAAILAGDTETGVTLFIMDEKIDHGPIIASSKISLENSKLTSKDLSEKLAKLGAGLIVKKIPLYLQNKITPRPQDESLATYCHKITPSEEKIDWHQEADYIDRKVRAFFPKPGVYTISSRYPIKIIKGTAFPDNTATLSKKPGETFLIDSKLAVKCGQGFYLIEKLQPAGKRIMNSKDFIAGNSWIINQVLS